MRLNPASLKNSPGFSLLKSWMSQIKPKNRVLVENSLPNSATLLEIKSRISGLTWKKIENFDNEGHILAPDKKWSDDYNTASLCNTTKHDFQVKPAGFCV